LWNSIIIDGDNPVLNFYSKFSVNEI